MNLVGDARATLQRLLPRIEQKSDDSFREQLEEEISQWWRLLETRAYEQGDTVNPQLVWWKTNEHLPDDVILTADSGSTTNWFARYYLKIKDGMRASLSGTLATMLPGPPYTLGAKFAHPDRPVLVSVGDGAMQMQGINVLIDIAKYWRRWETRSACSWSPTTRT